jgi:hypothetical protein
MPYVEICDGCEGDGCEYCEWRGTLLLADEEDEPQPEAEK